LGNTIVEKYERLTPKYQKIIDSLIYRLLEQEQ
jgi:hypothetical protein